MQSYDFFLTYANFFANFAKKHKKKRLPMQSLLGCGGRNRTNDLQVMSLTSYHCSTPRYIFRCAVLSRIFPKASAKVLLFFDICKFFSKKMRFSAEKRIFCCLDLTKISYFTRLPCALYHTSPRRIYRCPSSRIFSTDSCTSDTLFQPIVGGRMMCESSQISVIR